MGLTDRTRKILWARAGGRCSICRRLLVTDATGPDGPSVHGEEAHIVAKSAGGPRACCLSDIDAYDNLILLCSQHHKQIDDQHTYFTVDRLRQIKQSHEARVKTHGVTGHGPVRLVPDPTRPIPSTLRIFTT